MRGDCGPDGITRVARRSGANQKQREEQRRKRAGAPALHGRVAGEAYPFLHLI